MKIIMVTHITEVLRSNEIISVFIIAGIVSMALGILRGNTLHEEYLSSKGNSSQIDIDTLLKKINEANWCICIGGGLLLVAIFAVLLY